MDEDFLKSIKEIENLDTNTSVEIYLIQDDEIKYTNVRDTTFSEYSIQELKKMHGPLMSKIVHPDDVQFVMEQEINKTMGNSGTIKNYPFKIITKSGNVKLIELSSKTISYRGKNANLIFLRENSKNISVNLKNYHKNLMKFRDLLEIIKGLCLLINIGFKNTEMNFWLGIENLDNLYKIIKELILDNHSLEFLKEKVKNTEIEIGIGPDGDFLLNFKEE